MPNKQPLTVPDWVKGPDRYTWELGDELGEDRRWRRKMFPLLPPEFRMPAAIEYRKRYFRLGYREANLYLLNLTESFDFNTSRLSSDEDEINNYVAIRIRQLRPMGAKSKDELIRYEKMAEHVRWLGFSPPIPDGRITLSGAIKRMMDESWWRRQVRTRFGEILETKAIATGLVHARAGIYVSDHTFTAFKSRRIRNQNLLKTMEAVNELGDTWILQELVDLSVANPVNRRNELMARLHGFDVIAKSLDHTGLFITLTCPSRMHARYRSSGDPNPAYDGTTPRQANAYLSKVWARLRAALKNAGIHVYGFRVAEPQHDGTPHWHILLYSNPENEKIIREYALYYALADSPDEKGAQERRCTFKVIDWSKGTGIGYIAKYIAKNIDGEHLDADINGGDARQAAMRVYSWASVHRIRQFQQFGGPQVTCWRELRKISELTEGLLNEVREAADKGQWDAFTELCGGTNILRKDQPIRLFKDFDETPGRYGEPKGEIILGVTDGEEIAMSKIHTWEISRSAKQSRCWDAASTG